jgi:uncharacterized protein with FMN-binding domain
MKKIVLWFMSTVTAVVLMFGYHTSTSSSAAATAGGNASAEAPVSSTGTSTTSGTSSSATGTASSGAASDGAASSSAASSAATTTVTGSVASTRWGPVQVQLTVSAGKITAVEVVEYPNSNGKDQQINAQALPMLVKETLSAQSAKIDMVSGATYTSDGYITSLQSALDKAGL